MDIDERTDWGWCFDNPKEAARYIDTLLARVDELEKVLTQKGFTISADGKTYRPPVNKDAYAPKYFEAEQRITELEQQLSSSSERVNVLETALRESIRVYQVDDMAYDPKADVERRFQRYMNGGE